MQLGTSLKIPNEIIVKPPSPDLWPDQQAKSELGADYKLLDLILWGIEHRWTAPDIAEALDLPREFIDKIFWRWRNSEHKRRTPFVPKYSPHNGGA